MSAATITKSFPAIAKIWLIGIDGQLTNDCSMIIRVRIELVLNRAFGSSSVVVRVSYHVLTLWLLHLLVHFLEDIHVCVVL